MALTHDDVVEILAIIDASAPAEIELTTDGFSLHVVIGDGARAAAAIPRPTPPPEHLAPEHPAPAPPDGGAPPAAEGLETIESPVLGTFYRAESPGSDPFVEVGSVVEADTVVCILEVMKMMNSVAAGVAGRIVAVLPENGQLVEYGEPLFHVEPA